MKKDVFFKCILPVVVIPLKDSLFWRVHFKGDVWEQKKQFLYKLMCEKNANTNWRQCDRIRFVTGVKVFKN